MAIMRPLTVRERWILTITVILAILYIFLWSGKTSERNEEILNQKTVQTLKEYKKNLALLDREKEAQKNDERLLAPFFQTSSEDEEISRFLSTTETMAGKMKLKIREIKPGKVRKTEDLVYLSIQFDLEGTLLDIQHFLYVLQGDPYYYLVDDITLTPQTVQADRVDCQLHLSRVLVPQK